MLAGKDDNESLKGLIINADDFGLTEGINSGIISLFVRGVVKSASLMVTCGAFNNAIELIRRFPELDVGIHLVLIDEKPVCEPPHIKSLVCKKGHFFSVTHFLFRYFLGRIKKKDLEKELRAQFHRAINSGIKITHIDSHKHIHILPGILDIIIKLSREFNVKFVRCSDEGMGLKYMLSSSRINFKRLIVVYPIKILAKIAKEKLRKAGLDFAVSFFGLFNSGNLRLIDIEKMSTSLKGGISELMVHPGNIDDELMLKYGQWRYDWQREKDLLAQENVSILFKEKSISLLSFNDFEGQRTLN